MTYRKVKLDTALAIRLAKEIYEEVTEGQKMIVNYGQDAVNVKRVLAQTDNNVQEFLERWRYGLCTENERLWSCDLSSFCMPWRFNRIGAEIAIERRQDRLQSQRREWAADARARFRERKHNAG